MNPTSVLSRICCPVALCYVAPDLQSKLAIKKNARRSDETLPQLRTSFGLASTKVAQPTHVQPLLLSPGARPLVERLERGTQTVL